MEYTIKRNGMAVVTVRPEGTLSKKIMAEHNVRLSFSLASYVELRIGDTVEAFGETHYLNQLPQVEKNAKREYVYACVFEAQVYDLAKVSYMMMGDDNTLKEPDFALMGQAGDFLNLLIRNANRVQEGWRLGMVDLTDYRNLTFAKENCLQVLSKIALEYDTEFWAMGKTLHLTKRGPVSGLTFEYGKGKGLYKLTRQTKDGTNIFTRLYAYGAAKNLRPDYRNYSNRLLLPVLTGPYLEANTAEYGIIEHTQLWEDIYPHRTGTVSAVGDMHTFYDSGMDFDLNQYLLPGETAKVTFNSGQLAGYTFEVEKYDNASKRFTFLQNKEEESLQIPNEFLKPAPGDEYVLVDIFLPDEYVTKAENELQEKALEYLAKNSVPRVMYSVECDPLYFQQAGVYISLGSFVQVVDAVMGVDLPLRVVGLTRDLSNGYSYTLELSEAFDIPTILRDYADKEKIRRYIAQQSQPVAAPSLPAFVPEWRPLWLGPGFSTVGTNDNNYRAEYMKDRDGRVHLRGEVYTDNPTGVAFTLPSDARPGKTSWQNVHVQAGFGYLLLWNTGAVNFYPQPIEQKKYTFHLDGVSFMAEPKFVPEVVEPPQEPGEEYYVRLSQTQVSSFTLDCSGVPTYQYSVNCTVESNKPGTYTLSNTSSGKSATVTFLAGDTVKSVDITGNREFSGGDPYSVTIALQGGDAGHSSRTASITSSNTQDASTACQNPDPELPM